jgi:hypothetical protein
VGHPDGMTTSSFYLVLSVYLSFCLFVFLSICHSVSFGSTEELRVDELPVDRLRGSERSFYT